MSAVSDFPILRSRSSLERVCLFRALARMNTKAPPPRARVTRIRVIQIQRRLPRLKLAAMPVPPLSKAIEASKWSWVVVQTGPPIPTEKRAKGSHSLQFTRSYHGRLKAQPRSDLLDTLRRLD